MTEDLLGATESALRVALDGWLGARFRAHRGLDLRRFDELDDEQREAVADLEESEFYALLLPREGTRGTAKVVDRDTADLFAALREPARLPEVSGDEPGFERLRSVAMMVLDEVLQVESDGSFLGGPSAHPLLFGAAPRPPANGRLAQLSLCALSYAQLLPFKNPRELAHRLYSYNRVPIHARWKKRFAGAGRVEAALGLDSYGQDSVRLAADFESSTQGGWHSWTRPGSDPEKLRFKLYASPHPDSLKPTFHDAVTVFTELGVEAFKVGLDLPGLLRPDKIVAYFESFQVLGQVGRVLAPHLAGRRSQGVPFSAELTDDGMLSWGVDPPIEAALVPWRGVESWRLWICNQLATALLRAREDPASPVEPSRFALDRLRLQGVEVETWTPAGLHTAEEVPS